MVAHAIKGGPWIGKDDLTPHISAKTLADMVVSFYVGKIFLKCGLFAKKATEACITITLKNHILNWFYDQYLIKLTGILLQRCPELGAKFLFPCRIITA